MGKLKLLLFGFQQQEAEEIQGEADAIIASSTAASLAALNANEIDAVLLDLGALPLSARNLLTALRDPSKTDKAGVIVIGILQKNDPKTLQNMVKIGIDQFLIRPILISGLIREVTGIVGQSAAPSTRSDTYVDPDRRRIELNYNGEEAKRRDAEK